MGSLHLQRLTVGWLETNCYIIFDRRTLDAAVIDPGINDPAIADFIRTHHLQVMSIINTHGHADHIAGNTDLNRAFHCPVWIHEADQEALVDPRLNLSASFGIPVVSIPAARGLVDGETINLGGNTLQVLHTPGHSPGSICLLSAHWLISGDTLFYQSVGRTDLPGGDSTLLKESLVRKILPLHGDLKVYPGHGPATVLEKERQLNPYLNVHIFD